MKFKGWQATQWPFAVSLMASCRDLMLETKNTVIGWLFGKLITMVFPATRQHMVRRKQHRWWRLYYQKECGCLRDKNPGQQRDVRQKKKILDNEVEFIELTVPFSRHIGRTKAWKNIIKSVTGDGAELDVEMGNHRIDWAAISMLRCLSAKRLLASQRGFQMASIHTGKLYLGSKLDGFLFATCGPFHMGSSTCPKVTQSSQVWSLGET